MSRSKETRVFSPSLAVIGCGKETSHVYVLCGLD